MREKTSFAGIDKDNLHHAYCVEGSCDEIIPELSLFIERNLSFQTSGNPDYYAEVFETVGIDDARKLVDMQSGRSFSGKKIFIVGAGSVTAEAQNALLKLFEEPTPGTHFFLIVRKAEILLPTLKSRLFILSGNGSLKKNEQALSFLKGGVSDRFAISKSIAEKISEKKVDRGYAIEFLSALESMVHEELLKNPSPQGARAGNAVLKARKYAEDRSASIKMLLDNLAIDLPVKV